MSNTIEDPLKVDLTEFEQSVETPVVPGELPGWSELTEQRCERLGISLHDHISRHHRQLFEEITDQDPALASRVEEMIATDKTLLEQHHNMLARCQALRAESEFAEPHESQLDSRVESLVQAAVAAIVAIRRQEHSITTWYQESMLRERGGGD